MDSPAFDVWSTVLAVILVIIAIVNTAFTIRGVASGHLLGLKRGWRKRAYMADYGEEERIGERERRQKARENGSSGE